MNPVAEAKPPRAIDCNIHKIFCQIVENRPNINLGYAMKLSNVIYRKSKEHSIPAEIFTAILMQESSYRLGAEGIHCGNERGVKPLRKTCVVSDYGIAQIHYDTVDRYEFDTKLLLSDLNYSVDAGAEVLKWFHRKYSKKEPKRWYCRYNVGTRPAKSIKTACNVYLKLVERWLRKKEKRNVAGEIEENRIKARKIAY